MTAAGWIVMLVASGGTTGLLAWCIYKVLTTPGTEEHIHSQLDIDPQDDEDEKE